MRAWDRDHVACVACVRACMYGSVRTRPHFPRRSLEHGREPAHPMPCLVLQQASVPSDIRPYCVLGQAFAHVYLVLTSMVRLLPNTEILRQCKQPARVRPSPVRLLSPRLRGTCRCSGPAACIFRLEPHIFCESPSPHKPHCACGTPPLVGSGPWIGRAVRGQPHVLLPHRRLQWCTILPDKVGCARGWRWCLCRYAWLSNRTACHITLEAGHLACYETGCCGRTAVCGCPGTRRCLHYVCCRGSERIVQLNAPGASRCHEVGCVYANHATHVNARPQPSVMLGVQQLSVHNVCCSVPHAQCQHPPCNGVIMPFRSAGPGRRETDSPQPPVVRYGCTPDLYVLRACVHVCTQVTCGYAMRALCTPELSSPPPPCSLFCAREPASHDTAPHLPWPENAAPIVARR